MKKNWFFAIVLVLLSVVAYAYADIPIDAEHFPDYYFRSALSQNFGDSLSEDEITHTKKLNISKEMLDLTGIEYFTSLKELKRFDDQISLTSLDVSHNTNLEYLDCCNGQLTSLVIGDNSNLKNLYCDENALSSIDISGCTALAYFSCNQNHLISLDLENNPQLVSLSCISNQFKSLSLEKCKQLKYLYCDYNDISTLDLSQNTALIQLSCRDNLLNSLNLVNNVKLNSLDVRNNQITALDVTSCTLLCGLVQETDRNAYDNVQDLLRNGTSEWWGEIAKTFLCVDHNVAVIADEIISYSDHLVLVYHKKEDPSCTVAGSDNYWTCYICGKLFSDKNATNEIESVPVISPSGHTIVDIPAVAPSATSSGMTAGQDCAVCGAILIEQKALPALNNLSVLHLPLSLQCIEKEALSGLGCQAIVIPDGCTAIGVNAFFGLHRVALC